MSEIKRKVSILMALLLLFVLIGCESKDDFAVIDSNLADYQKTEVKSTIQQFNISFNQKIAEAEVNLIENENYNKDIETDISDNKIIIKNLNLEAMTDYQLIIAVKSINGQELTTKYQFQTKAGNIAVEHPKITDKNETLLQAFYWEMGEGDYEEKYPSEKDLWKLLSKRANDFSELGITSIWIPPANKAKSSQNFGYAVYDLWDLGEFEQAGSVRTKYGTKQELELAISNLHSQNIKIYYDAVLNHRIGIRDQNIESVTLESGKEIKAYTYFPDLKGREYYYSKADQWEWNWKQFDGVNSDDRGTFAVPNIFNGKTWDDSYDQDYLLGADVDYQNSQVKDEINEWGSWLVNDLGVDGFIIDTVEHIDSAFVNQWIDKIQASSDKDVFFIGEAGIKNKMGLSFYLSSVNNENLAVLDFPLRNRFKNLSTAMMDMSFLKTAGLVNNPKYSDRVVTFVDGYDSSKYLSEYNTPVTRYKMQAYTYILTREEGKPVVYWKDYYQNGYQQELKRLLEIRKYYAYGPGREVEDNRNKVYSYIREGLKDKPKTGLVAMISVGASGEVVSKKIKTNKDNTVFYDYTGNITEKVTTDNQGYGEFKVRKSQNNGWSVWVPSNKEK